MSKEDINKTIGEILAEVDQKLRAEVAAEPTKYPVNQAYLIGRIVYDAMFGKHELAYAKKKGVDIGSLTIHGEVSRNSLCLETQPSPNHPLVKDARLLWYKMRDCTIMVDLEIKMITDQWNHRHQHITGLKLDALDFGKYTVKEFIDFQNQLFWCHAERQLKAVCTIADLRDELGKDRENEIMAAYNILFGCYSLQNFSEACFNDDWAKAVKNVYEGHLKHGGYEYPTYKSITGKEAPKDAIP